LDRVGLGVLGTHLPKGALDSHEPILPRVDGTLYRGNIPRVPRATGYGPKLWYDRFPPAANDGGAIHPIPGNDPTTLGCRGGATNLKELIPGTINAITSPPYD
jgi:hypothetical protein